MTLTAGQLLSDQGQVFKDFPTEPITIAGTTYGCLVMEQTKGNTYDIGGKTDELTLRVAINRNEMTTIPERGTTATFSSQSVRIADVAQDDLYASIVLTLENLTVG